VSGNETAIPIQTGDVRPVLLDLATWARWAERLAPQIDRMAEGSSGHYRAEDIIAAIVNREFQVWLALDGPDVGCVLLTQVVIYPRMAALRCIALVGARPERWVGLLAWVEAEAVRTFGCSRIEALHPPGHERLLTTGGWSTFHVLSEKHLCAA
jgi:hypothetical protein